MKKMVITALFFCFFFIAKSHTVIIRGLLKDYKALEYGRERFRLSIVPCIASLDGVYRNVDTAFLISESGMFYLEVSDVARLNELYFAFEKLNINVANYLESGDTLDIACSELKGQWVIDIRSNRQEKFDAMREVDFDKRGPNIHNGKIGTNFLQKMALFKKYEPFISRPIYHILRADAFAKDLGLITIMLYETITKEDVEWLKVKKDSLLNLVYQLDSFINDEIKVNDFVFQSVSFLELVSNLNLMYLMLASNENTAFSELLTLIDNKYDGVLKEILLGYQYIRSGDRNYFKFLGIQEDVYKEKLKWVISMQDESLLKKRLEVIYNSRTKGAQAFAFNFVADSSDKIIRLGDYSGKVVLLDVWGDPCGACRSFSQSFHEYVYPYFKNDSLFKVVSVLSFGSDMYPKIDDFIYRLRQRGKIAYTFPEYDNLFAGIGQDGTSIGRKMLDYYMINGAPFILLIDKKGKVYSSTLPRVSGFLPVKENVRRAKELINIIEAAIKER